MAMDNDSIQCYDYEMQQVVAMIQNVTENSAEILTMSSFECSSNSEQVELAYGDSNGDLRFLKYPQGKR